MLSDGGDEPSDCSRSYPALPSHQRKNQFCLFVGAGGSTAHTPPTRDLDWRQQSKTNTGSLAFQALLYAVCLTPMFLRLGEQCHPTLTQPVLPDPTPVAGSDFGPLCTTSTACWCDGGLFLPFRSPDSASFTLLGANLCGSRDNLFLQAGNPSPGRLPHSSTAPTLPPRSVRASPSQILLL